MTEFADMCCGKCGIEFKVPAHFRRERVESRERWYCPNGHNRIFTESVANKLQREIDRLKQNQSYLEDSRREAEAATEHALKQAQGYKGQMVRLQKRASAGSCPCCKRNFTNLARHMTIKHPDFGKLEAV